MAHRSWRLKQPQPAELPLLNDLLVHALRRRTALAQEHRAGKDQHRPSGTATDQAAHLL